MLHSDRAPDDFDLFLSLVDIVVVLLAVVDRVASLFQQWENEELFRAQSVKSFFSSSFFLPLSLCSSFFSTRRTTMLLSTVVLGVMRQGVCSFCIRRSIPIESREKEETCGAFASSERSEDVCWRSWTMLSNLRAMLTDRNIFNEKPRLFVQSGFQSLAVRLSHNNKTTSFMLKYHLSIESVKASFVPMLTMRLHFYIDSSSTHVRPLSHDVLSQNGFTEQPYIYQPWSAHETLCARAKLMAMFVAAVSLNRMQIRPNDDLVSDQTSLNVSLWTNSVSQPDEPSWVRSSSDVEPSFCSR